MMSALTERNQGADKNLLCRASRSTTQESIEVCDIGMLRIAAGRSRGHEMEAGPVWPEIEYWNDEIFCCARDAR
jgi:hypothetical protein